MYRLPDDAFDGLDPVPEQVSGKEPDMLWCNRGKHWQPATNFHRNRQLKRGRCSSCKDCVREAAGSKPRRDPSIPDGHKRCTNCGKVLPFRHFSIRDEHKTGLMRYRPYCRPCDTEIKRHYSEQRRQDPERYRHDLAKGLERGKNRVRRHREYRHMMKARVGGMIRDLKALGYTYVQLEQLTGRNAETLSRWANPTNRTLPDLPPMERTLPILERLLADARSATTVQESADRTDDDDDIVPWDVFAESRKHAAD